MNILHLTPYAPPAYAFGGVVRAVEGMTTALAARGHQVVVLTTDALNATERIPMLEEVTPGGVHIIRARNRSTWLRGRANLSTPLGIRRLAREYVAWADVVHTHEFRTFENVLILPIAARLNKPVLLSPHATLTHETGRSHLKAVWDRLLSPSVAYNINDMVALTAAEAEEARAAWRQFAPQHIPNLTVTVIPNGIDADFYAPLRHDTGRRAAFREQYGLGDATVCLFMGRLHARKGVDLLVRAFQQANMLNTHLVIVGPDEGMLPALQRLAAHDPRITLTGYLDGEARLNALADADLFALPAVGEGLSIAALEALAAGLPAILSPGCNLPEAEAAGAAVIVLPQVTPLADALRQLLPNVARRQSMGDAGQTLVRERFTWERVGEQLEAVYTNMVDCE